MKYWVKLYAEILDDSKMGIMPDRIWRRTIELFLLAGKIDKGGVLPGTREIAWSLRMDTNELEGDLRQIEMTGIIERDGDGWTIPNFSKRQGPSKESQRVLEWREKQRNSYVTVTKQNGNNNVPESESESESYTESEGEIDDVDIKRVFSAYHDNIGLITPTISDALIAMLKDCPADWIVAAIEIAVKNNARKYSYVDAILKNWIANGRDVGKKSKDDRNTDKARRKYAEWGAEK